jgi:protein TonB
VALAVGLGLQHEAPRPPVYRVEMIGAPKGERQAGVVTPAASAAPTKADAPSGAERTPVEKAMPNKKSPVAPAPKATPSPAKSKSAGAKTVAPAKNAKSAPKAGSGREGGKGADVRNVSLNGIAFPFPGYLTNIMRQISIAYTPRRVSAALVAEVKFLIRRDGSVAGIEVVKSSGDRLFDLEAQATVESVGASRNFGPLPSGWTDDVLVVYFTFDYALRPS